MMTVPIREKSFSLDTFRDNARDIRKKSVRRKLQGENKPKKKVKGKSRHDKFIANRMSGRLLY